MKTGRPRADRFNVEPGKLPPIEREQFRPTEAEYLHAISLIPPDTRDLTARFFGDPIPGDTRRPHHFEPTRFGNHGSPPLERSTARG